MKEPTPLRYQPHRQLPRAAFLPGRTQAGSRSGPTPAIAARPEHEAPRRFAAEDWLLHSEYLWGVDLYNLGFYWEAHEAWEGLWRAAEHASSERRFLQGLIQCAAACLKARVGQPSATQRLSERGLTRLMRVQSDHGDCYMGLELARFIPAFREFAALQTTAWVLPPHIHLAIGAP
jgi:uncharacterized protein